MATAKPTIYSFGNMPKLPGKSFGTIDKATGEFIPGISRTKQEFLGETSIKKMMEQWTRTGIAPIASTQPMYLDSSDLPDFQTSRNLIANVETAFRLLPADMRAEFKNNEANFVDWILDPKNNEEAVEYGLLAPPMEGEPSAPSNSEPESESAPAVTSTPKAEEKPPATPPIRGGE